MSPAQLTTSDLWRRDPDWLTSAELSVYQEEDPTCMPEECIQEVRAKDRGLPHSLVVVEPTTRIGQLIRCEHFSSAQRLLRVTAYVVIATEKFKKKLRETTTLIVPLLNQAETFWVKEAQTRLLKCVRFHDWKKELSLFVDPEGVWRCGGRLSNTDILYMTRHTVHDDTSYSPTERPLSDRVVSAEVTCKSFPQWHKSPGTQAPKRI